MKNRKLKRVLAAVLTAAIVFAFLPVYAGQTFKDKSVPFTFSYPDGYDINRIEAEGSALSFTDEDFTSITITATDLYYTISNETTPELDDKYPKDELWIGCGLFEKSWNNMDHVNKYLMDSVNGGDSKYKGETKRTEINTLPGYEFRYVQEKASGSEISGGVMYVFLYKGILYNVGFYNFFNHKTANTYAKSFMDSVKLEGIESFGFINYHQKNESAQDQTEAKEDSKDKTQTVPEQEIKEEQKESSSIASIIFVFVILIFVAALVVFVQMKNKNRRKKKKNVQGRKKQQHKTEK